MPAARKTASRAKAKPKSRRSRRKSGPFDFLSDFFSNGGGHKVNKGIFLLVALACIFFVTWGMDAQHWTQGLIHKSLMVMTGATIGFWIDYLLFPKIGDLDDEFSDEPVVRASFAIRRALIVSFSILAMAIGLG